MKGNACQIESDSRQFIGKRIGQTVDGEVIGVSGRKLLITGGSDRDGLPMRMNLPGSRRRRILKSEKGGRKRKSVRGSEISAETVQINVKIVEE